VGQPYVQKDWSFWDPDHWRIDREEVHVWRRRADVISIETEPDLPVLSVLERRRATKFVRVKDRALFVTGRCLLRCVLANHLGCTPGDLTIVPDPFGKPRLSTPPSEELDFNVSHSGDYVLVSLAIGRRVGVDIEEVRRGVDTQSIMRELFTPCERAVVAAFNGEAREAAFFRYWTRKEALSKAIGTGLSASLDTLDVRSDLRDAWEVRTIPVGRRYRAAVAAEGQGWQLRCWNA
jgi:4'-phosphopantetheinyl transferase